MTLTGMTSPVCGFLNRFVTVFTASEIPEELGVSEELSVVLPLLLSLPEEERLSFLSDEAPLSLVLPEFSGFEDDSSLSNDNA